MHEWNKNIVQKRSVIKVGETFADERRYVVKRINSKCEVFKNRLIL